VGFAVKKSRQPVVKTRLPARPRKVIFSHIKKLYNKWTISVEPFGREKRHKKRLVPRRRI
jgi:hypothetical protein